jgi:hypothetical protein
MIVGPGNDPLTVRTLLETPSKAAVVLVSSNQYCNWLAKTSLDMHISYLHRITSIRHGIIIVRTQVIITPTGFVGNAASSFGNRR